MKKSLSGNYPNLSKQIAIVTGGGRGIGRAICDALLKAQATVICAELDIQLEEKLPKDLEFLHVDVSKIEKCKRAVKSIVNKHGRVDILVNNAAIQPSDSYRPLHQSDITIARKMIDTNILGYRNMAQCVLPSMLQAHRGNIVNIASVQGHRSAKEVDPYGVTKAANLAQTRQWAVEYARDGIRVNSVSPGAIRTDLILGTLREQGGEADLANRHPLGRLGEPAEVAGVVLFLLSSSASFITGADLPVDGGLCAVGAFAPPFNVKQLDRRFDQCNDSLGNEFHEVPFVEVS